MNIDETILAIECCTQPKPQCAKCPQQGPGFGIACRQDVKENVLRWLNWAKEKMANGQENKD